MNSVVNFRDIGGFPTQQGTVVKTGHFFRSGELVNVAQADQQKLSLIHISEPTRP